MRNPTIYKKTKPILYTLSGTVSTTHEIHATVCRKWRHRLKVEWWLVSPESHVEKEPLPVGRTECINMREVHLCEGQRMTQYRAVWRFDDHPHLGPLPFTVSIYNCIVEPITLYRSCPNCSVESNRGVASSTADTGFGILDHATYVWRPERDVESTVCHERVLYSSWGEFHAGANTSRPHPLTDYVLQTPPTLAPCHGSVVWTVAGTDNHMHIRFYNDTTYPSLHDRITNLTTISSVWTDVSAHLQYLSDRWVDLSNRDSLQFNAIYCKLQHQQIFLQRLVSTMSPIWAGKLLQLAVYGSCRSR